MPFAAFFVAVCLLLCIPDRTRKALLCLLLGAAAGLAAARHTNARLEQTLEKYAGQTVALTAEVESVSASYYPGIVDAVLRVERVNGRAAEFRVECDTLPVCEAGERVEGRFALEAPEPADRTTLFADGAALLAKEPQAFARLGQGSSFRARTGRLQKRLSTSLRGEMNEDAGGVLAAMTVGDRNHLSSALRSAYRGAGLSHVLVVSGMHVSILCGDVFGRRRRERSYRSRRVKALFTAFLALLLAGVTGFTPSVCRAAVAVWVSALGVWVYGASDALTSLAAAGILMTARNSYAVCDIGFELSFAAVVGTVAGGACIRRIREWWCQDFWKKSENPVRRPWYLRVFPAVCFCGDLSSSGAAGAEREPVGGGFRRGGALAGAAHASAEPWHRFCGACPGGRAVVSAAGQGCGSPDRPAESLGRVGQRQAWGGAVF